MFIHQCCCTMAVHARKILLINNMTANFSQSIWSIVHLHLNTYFLYVWRAFSERNITVRHLFAYVPNGIKTNVNFIKTAWGGHTDTEDVKGSKLNIHTEPCLNVFCGKFSFRHLTVLADSPLSVFVWILLQTENSARNHSCLQSPAKKMSADLTLSSLTRYPVLLTKIKYILFIFFVLCASLKWKYSVLKQTLLWMYIF